MKSKVFDQTTDRGITHLRVPKITNSGNVVIQLKPGGVVVVQYEKLYHKLVLPKLY